MEDVISNSKIVKYPKYKDSGFEWSGLTPKEWEALPIRAIFEERNEKNNGPKTDFILSVTKDRGVIPYDEKGAIGNNKSEDIERYKLVYPNDFVINKMNVVIGSLGLSKYFGAFSQVYLVYKPRTTQININYYSYIFSNPPFYKSLIKYCTGIMELRESLNKDDFKKLLLPFPDYKTQTAIAQFLNGKTALIDQAIGIKEKQIQLLKERLQILIHKAVTRGINANVKMKNSGVEWIGEIPEHWIVKKLKYVSGNFMYGTSVDCNELSSGTPVLRIPNIGELYINFDNLKYVALSEVETKKYLLKKNDILIVRTNGNPALVGKSALFDGIGEYMFASYLIKVKPMENIEGDFLILTMNSFSIRSSLSYSSRTSAGNYNLNTQALGDCYLAYPPKNEQKSIIEWSEIQSSKITTAISLKEQEIEKLKEYKATLINSAVTGKIKVS